MAINISNETGTIKVEITSFYTNGGVTLSPSVTYFNKAEVDVSSASNYVILKDYNSSISILYSDITTPSGASANAIANTIQAFITGGGGGGTSTWTPNGITTSTVGGIASGTDLGTSPVLIDTTLNSMFYPYVSPSFASFSFSQTSPVEVGTTISGSKSFGWAFNTPANVSPNTMDIYDVTGATYLATDISTTSPSSQNIGTVQLTAPGTYSWRGYATNTNSVQFQSANFTISWLWRKYVGVDAGTTLNEAGIEALATSNALSSSLSGTYVFGASATYKYFCCPDTFAAPTATTGFKDSSTGFPISMAGVAEGYTLTDANGWNYQSVSVTNAQGQTINYRVYRSLNVINGAITIIVS